MSYTSASTFTPTLLESSYSSNPSEGSTSNLASTDLVYTSGPLPEPTVFPIITLLPSVLPPASTTGRFAIRMPFEYVDWYAEIPNSGGIVPIIPIVPFPLPPAGFIPPVSEPAPVRTDCPQTYLDRRQPPGTPNPDEETCPNPQDNECSKCGGEYGWCQHSPNAGCPCQEACTEGEYTPDCGDQQCEGDEDNQCTVGPQKGCDCKPACQEGQDRVSSFQSCIKSGLRGADWPSSHCALTVPVKVVLVSSAPKAPLQAATASTGLSAALRIRSCRLG